jgi:hypothetical protein
MRATAAPLLIAIPPERLEGLTPHPGAGVVFRDVAEPVGHRFVAAEAAFPGDFRLEGVVRCRRIAGLQRREIGANPGEGVVLQDERAGHADGDDEPDDEPGHW